jgi:DNA-binding beta-propeller fold protein YncE
MPLYSLYSVIYDSSYDGDRWQTGMGNLPTISDHWSDYTQGRNATVTKLVVTQDWQGEPLNFDVWAPAIPDACSTLQWKPDEAYRGSAVYIKVTEYPSHLHVTVTPNQPLNPLSWDTRSRDAVPPGGPSRELVYSFMLWWKHSTTQPDSAPYLYCSQFGSLGTGNGQFGNNSAYHTKCPFSVAFDPSDPVDGSVLYVTDPANNRIQKFNAAGTFIREWGKDGSGPADINHPFGVAVNPVTHDVFVTDDDHHRIQHFTDAGAFIKNWGTYCNVQTSEDCNINSPGARALGDGQFDHPEGIAVDPSGKFVYVADDNKRIQKFTSDGQFVMKFGSPGINDSQFYSVPKGLAVDSSGNIYVSDTYDFRVQKFDSNGNFITTKWTKEGGQPGSGDGEFATSSVDGGGPHGIAVDHEGNVYVADTGNNRIQKFSSDGTFLAKWGSYGTAEGQLNEPMGVAVDQSGNVFVADSWNYRIQVFVPSSP